MPLELSFLDPRINVSVKPDFGQVAMHDKNNTCWKDGRYVLILLEVPVPCVIDLLWRDVCPTMSPFLSSLYPWCLVLSPVYRVEASAVSGQAKHAELSEGGRADHAAQCLDARHHQHQSHFRGGVSAELASHRADENRCVSLPRAAGDDASHKEREACLQGESERCRRVLRWSGVLKGMLCNSWGINTAITKLVSIPLFLDRLFSHFGVQVRKAICNVAGWKTFLMNPAEFPAMNHWLWLIRKAKIAFFRD